MDVRIDNRSLICESIKNRKIDFFNTALLSSNNDRPFLVQEELVWAKGDLPISSAFTIIQWVAQIERKAVQLILSIIISSFSRCSNPRRLHCLQNYVINEQVGFSFLFKDSYYETGDGTKYLLAESRPLWPLCYPSPQVPFMPRCLPLSSYLSVGCLSS